MVKINEVQRMREWIWLHRWNKFMPSMLCKAIHKEGEDMLKLGDLIMPGDDLDGATLCGYCQNHFKGDGDMDTCKECI